MQYLSAGLGCEVFATSGMGLHGLRWPGGMQAVVFECLLLGGALLLMLWTMRQRTEAHKVVRDRERALREELEAYARLDTSLGQGGDAKALARRVCQMVVQKGAFRRVALMIRTPEGKLCVTGSIGMDDVAVAALQDWGDSAVRRERGVGASGPAGPEIRETLGGNSFPVALAARIGLDATCPETRGGCRRAIVTMLRTQSGGILGALAVCADDARPAELNHALVPIEALAVKLARSMENASLTERLSRAERLAGLGQLAGGVAHELNNPLTAVLGYAELIADGAADARTREDAHTIILEAKRMKETIESLLMFWRPPTRQELPVRLGAVLTELAAECTEKLESRGVALDIQMSGDLPPVRGDKERLRQVLEHLLNNSAQAIASSNPGRRANDPPTATGLPRGTDALDEAPSIRVTVTYDATMLHLIVSDTGPGFAEPARVFDPFYTTREPGAGAGLGLSICYGIVREHGGEISAFNLQPHGAAVVVELPLAKTLIGEEETGVLLREDAGMRQAA